MMPGQYGLGAALFGEGSRQLDEASTFATDPKYRNREDAVQNYTHHIEGMGWPEELVDALAMEAEYAPGNSAEAVYAHMYRETPGILEDMQISESEVRNFQKNQNWLKEAGEASGWTTSALEDARWGNILWSTVVKSAQDVRTAIEKAGELADPKKSPWPWIIGAGLLIYLLK